MDELVRLDGTPIDVANAARDERIASHLAQVSTENDAGRVSAIVTVYVTPEGTHAASWILPLEDFGFPWGLALRGALAYAQHTIGDAVIPAPARPNGEAGD